MVAAANAVGVPHPVDIVLGAIAMDVVAAAVRRNRQADWSALVGDLVALDKALNAALPANA